MEKHSESSDLKLLNRSRTDKIYSIEEIAKLSKEIFVSGPYTSPLTNVLEPYIIETEQGRE